MALLLTNDEFYRKKEIDKLIQEYQKKVDDDCAYATGLERLRGLVSKIDAVKTAREEMIERVKSFTVYYTDDFNEANKKKVIEEAFVKINQVMSQPLEKSIPMRLVLLLNEVKG